VNRLRLFRSVLALACVLLMLACTPESQAPQAENLRSGTSLVDHHVHLLSPALMQDWRRVGARFSREDSAYTSIADLMLAQDGQGPMLDAALLVPMAHLYGDPEFRTVLGLSIEQEQARVRAENMSVAAEAVRYHGRAVATCSVPALRPYALEELRFCHRKLDVRGLKLHLASSGVDLRDADHRARVRELVAYADQNGLFLLLHLDPQRRGHERDDIDTFIDEVLAPHPGLFISVAHLGGSGGYGGWTRTVLSSFIDWLEAQQAAGIVHDRIYFDLSAVVLVEPREGLAATTPEELALLAGDLRRLGLSRVLFGSDYPVFSPTGVRSALAELLPLEPSELGQVLDQRFPPLSRPASFVSDEPARRPTSAPTRTPDGKP
jgi:predicted TIM-barrel fold metal-dependent hydrolase